MRALNVNDFIFDLDRVKAITNGDSKMASLIEKLQYMINEYEKQHPIEVEPVRHGRWIDTPIGTIECSECGYGYNLVGMFTFYCPHCGAKMDLKE